MNPVPISRTKVESKLAIIRDSVAELGLLSKLSKEEFLNDKMHFAVSEHYLRRALEAVFDIAGHVASRNPMPPAKRPSTYKELAVFMGEMKIVDEAFGKDILATMAGYRNRMVHFYDEITQEELYAILQERLPDIETFARAVVTLLNNPGKFGLHVSDL